MPIIVTCFNPQRRRAQGRNCLHSVCNLYAFEPARLPVLRLQAGKLTGFPHHEQRASRLHRSGTPP
jgi:hypothetical protein